MFSEKVIESFGCGLDAARERLLKNAKFAGKFVVNAAQQIVDIGHDLVDQERYDVLKKVAKVNSVSGCLSRWGMTQALNTIIREEAPEKVLVSYVDAINFKPNNDEFGHHNGDLLLAISGWGLREIFRPPNQANSDALVACWGGDEFMCIMPPDRKMDESAFGNSLTFYDIEGRSGKVVWNFKEYRRFLEETEYPETSPIYNGIKHVTDLGIDSLTYRFTFDEVALQPNSTAESVIDTFAANNTVKTATHLRAPR